MINDSENWLFENKIIFKSKQRFKSEEVKCIYWTNQQDCTK